MLERTERLLRLGCLVLGALLLFQVARIFIHRNPVAHLQIPALPTLADEGASVGHTNAPAGQEQQHGQNSTNLQNSVAAKGTNTSSEFGTSKGGTNSSAETASGKGPGSPSITQPERQSSPSTSAEGHVVTTLPAGTNIAAKSQAPAMTGTNLPVNLSQGGKAASNSPPVMAVKPGSSPTLHPPANLPPGALAGMPGGPPGMPGKARELPPEILARLDRITDSEVLGPIMHPLPMALLGIAGNVAFLRAPSGQTGLVKEGEKLGELKLLRIGMNRVLVEDDGQKKELTIFSGLGGESLLPNESKPSP
ncbi:MAG TPA: hypothetical protein VHI52_09635 [Verrucomicrobiae bacterium]|nr:hypothetical protein [Verrucomicrobiae bacterium]